MCASHRARYETRGRNESEGLPPVGRGEIPGLSRSGRITGLSETSVPGRAGAYTLGPERW